MNRARLCTGCGTVHDRDVSILEHEMNRARHGKSGITAPLECFNPRARNESCPTIAGGRGVVRDLAFQSSSTK